MGCGAECQRLPGKSQTFGLSRLQCSRKAAKQDGAEHHIAVFPALAAADMDDHARAVDIADLQSCHLGATRPGGVESHQQNLIEGVAGRVNQPGDFFLTEHQGQATHLFGA